MFFCFVYFILCSKDQNNAGWMDGWIDDSFAYSSSNQGWDLKNI
jgi:hypothetical protein